MDNYIREKDGSFPVQDSVYEYYVDQINGTFLHWDNKLPPNWKYDDESVLSTLNFVNVNVI